MTAVDGITPTLDLLRVVRSGYLPPPELTVSEFSDQEIVVTSGPLAGTHWQTAFAPYQRGILDAFHEKGVEIVAVMGSSQWGKALAIDTPIATPDGWTTMGALAKGDTVFDELGQQSCVTFATPVMLERTCYRVRFCDGSSLVADADHQWLVESDHWTGRPRGTQTKKPVSAVLTTAEIAKSWRTAWGANRYAIQVTQPLSLPARELPVDPYLLGVWLGDGHTLHPVITVHESDQELLEHMKAIGAKVEVTGRSDTGTLTVRIDARIRRPSCRECGRGFPLERLGPESAWRRIKAMGLTVGKTIPRDYLRGSGPQRWALLQGLMDTDGAVERKGQRCQFTTTAPGLAETFGELLSSLGIKYTSRKKIPTCKYRGKVSIGAEATLFHFTAYQHQPIFRLSRKQARLVPVDGSVRRTRPTETRRRRIVDVKPVPSVPVKCISVDSQNSMYLAGREMIPTHNTSIAVNIVAYHVAHDPCTILIVEPTVDPMAKDFAKNRLDPVISASPILLAAVSKKRAKDASNTTLQKTFRGGSLAIGGANSAASLAARSVRLLVLDEIDRYPAELPGEGSTLAVAMKRTSAYRRRRRILMVSSPTLKGGPIHSWHGRGDQRRFYVPCPACSVMHPFEWQQVRWVDEDPATARLHCPACDHGISEAERVAILADGEWRADKPERAEASIVSFHMWEAYSPLSSLEEIVKGFLRARALQKTGDRSEMHTWQNTTLGEPVDPDIGEGVEPHTLLIRREAYPSDVPAGACCLTMGVDVQDDRLEALIVGWGPGEESWLIDRHTLPGDTSQPEPWRMLDELLERPYEHESGQTLMIHSTCIDSAGHRTTLVYDYAHRKAGRRVYAIIGRDGQRPIVSSPSPRRWGRQERQIPLYTVGVDAAKALFVSRLALTQDTQRQDVHGYPGYVHIPHTEWADEELASQLTSERLVLRWHKGVPRQEWKKIRPRNEMLDCAVYAIAALRLLNPKLAVMAAALSVKAAKDGEPQKRQPPPSPPPAPRPRTGRSNYLTR